MVNMDGFFKAPDGSKGEPLPSIASGDGVQMPLMPGKFMPGLVEGLVGVKKDETRSITVTFPPRSSAPQLAGKEAIFEVSCLKVQDRVYPEVNDDFADKVKPGMSWAELDEKLREGVELEMAERKKGMTHQELQKALVTVLPDDFEVPETLQEQVAKERFAMMLSDMREKGATDEDLKEIITTENYERYKKISQNMIESQVKGDFALKHICQEQGLVVSRDEIDEEVMTLQRGALQKGEKFKESEVRPKVEAQLEKDMVLNWLEERAKITTVEGEVEVNVDEVLGASPEELAKRVVSEEMAAATAETKEAAEPKSASPAPAEASPTPTPSSETPTPAEATPDSVGAPTIAPDGFDWGGTF
uniref:Trigger factor C-terminal domain-containing protein n=1 Tax=Haptolina ericina TaxID=156174 RepID=A0A7S3FFI3_9EUKA